MTNIAQILRGKGRGPGSCNRDQPMNLMWKHTMNILQMSAQVGDLAGDGAADGARGQSFVDLAVQRQ